MTMRHRIRQLEAQRPLDSDVEAILLVPGAPRGAPSLGPVAALLTRGGSLARGTDETAMAFAARVEAEIARARP